jgi:AraC family transcriptional activator of pyochelin receptor
MNFLFDTPVILLHCGGINPLPYECEGIPSPSPRGLQLHLVCGPRMRVRSHFMSGQVYEAFDFHLTREMLKDYATAFPELEHFLKQAGKKGTGQLGNQSTLTKKMQKMLKEIEEFRCRPGIYKKIMKAKIEVFIAEALEILCTKKPPKKIVITPELKEKAFQAKLILENRLKDPPSIAELARLCTSNSYSIQFAFKNLFSMTIDEYSKQARMDCAKNLLLNTDWDLDSIADDTGYHDGPSLSRYFKKHVGCTPGEYRKYGRKKCLGLPVSPVSIFNILTGLTGYSLK